MARGDELTQIKCMFFNSIHHVPASTATARACREVKLNVTHTSGKREVVVSGVRSGSALLGDDLAGWGTAHRKGALTSREAVVRETPSGTYLRPLCFATRDGCQLYCESAWEEEFGRSRQAGPLSGPIDNILSAPILADVYW